MTMDYVQKFDIELEKDVYYAGEVIKGKVVVVTVENIKVKGENKCVFPPFLFSVVYVICTLSRTYMSRNCSVLCTLFAHFRVRICPVIVSFCVRYLHTFSYVYVP